MAIALEMLSGDVLKAVYSDLKTPVNPPVCGVKWSEEKEHYGKKANNYRGLIVFACIIFFSFLCLVVGKCGF